MQRLTRHEFDRKIFLTPRDRALMPRHDSGDGARRGRELSAAPVASVIVPSYNRPDTLMRCLESLARQSFPPERFEVIVIDDGSLQPLSAPATLAPGGTPVVFVRQTNTGPAGARNRGLAEARGEYVAFIDDDCQADARWLEILIAALRSRPGAAVGGTVVNALDRNPFAEASQILVSFVRDYYRRRRARGSSPRTISFPREALSASGGFADSTPAQPPKTVSCAIGGMRRDARCDRRRSAGASPARPDVPHVVGSTTTTGWSTAVPRAIAARKGDRVRVEPPRFYLGL